MEIRPMSCAACWLLVFVLAAGPPAAFSEGGSNLVSAIDRTKLTDFASWVCGPKPGEHFPEGASLVSRDDLARRGQKIGVVSVFEYADNSQITVQVFGSQDQIRQIHLSLRDALGRPSVFVRADSVCALISGRAFRYEDDSAVALVGLDQNLEATGVEDPVNPTRPPADGRTFNSHAIRVALVDSGVDYRESWLASRTAINKNGQWTGYDFWDDDRLPFDSNPSRSAFFPARHGTRVASIILNESSVVELVPYRYPRFNMQRMTSLIEDAKRSGVRIMNLSLGSRDANQWATFEQAAKDSEILYVVSAGNDGSDLDAMPLFPASLSVDNMLVVTSANDDGSLARGSGFGRNTVDLLVAGENKLTRDFAGLIRKSSGSSFAAARLSAFAACLLAASPELSALDLKKRVLQFATTVGQGVTVSGFLDIQLGLNRGACSAQSSTPVVSSKRRTLNSFSEQMARVVTTELLEFSATVVRVSTDDWRDDQIEQMVSESAQLLSQCNLRFKKIDIIDVVTSLETRQISYPTMTRLGKATAGESQKVLPRIFLMHDTMHEIEFGAQAIARSNARRRPQLRDTIWITRWTPNPGIALAHELVHMLSDSGLHKTQPDNLMNLETSATTRLLTQAQCGQVRNIGLGNGLLQRINVN